MIILSTDDHCQPIARFQLQGLARLAWDHNLVLGGKPYLGHRFTFDRVVKERDSKPTYAFVGPVFASELLIPSE